MGSIWGVEFIFLVFGLFISPFEIFFRNFLNFFSNAAMMITGVTDNKTINLDTPHVRTAYLPPKIELEPLQEQKKEQQVPTHKQPKKGSPALREDPE